MSSDRADPTPIEALDALIVTMEQQRDDARRLLRRCTPADGARLAAAIDDLEAKLALARKRRDVFAARRERIARMAVLQAELKTLSADLLTIPADQRQGPRGTAIFQRLDEIRAEAEELRRAREETEKG